MPSCCGSNNPTSAKPAGKSDGCCGESTPKPAASTGDCCGDSKQTPGKPASGCCGGSETESKSTDSCCGGEGKPASSGGCCGETGQKPEEPLEGCCDGGAEKPEKTSNGCCKDSAGRETGAEADCCGDRDAVVVRSTTSQLTAADRWDHVLARWGYRRGQHRVAPGLYALGNPTPDSPVWVTANYSLSFDALRSALPGIDGYILVLDTNGINVWCAAGKGAFGTEELVKRIARVRLKDVVRHRKLILPQLGAPGVAAHLVKKRSGFLVEYGPVRASDLPEYLKTGSATPEMRRVQFPLADRMTLVPIELMGALFPMAAAAAAAFLLAGWPVALAVVLTFLAGVVFFPMLFPWIPTKDYSTRGWILGILAVLAPALAVGLQGEASAGLRWILALSLLLILPPVSAYLALNFTGATPFPSRTGVKREIYAYIPKMAVSGGAGILLAVLAGVLRLAGRV